jgi:hypothetical protein
VNFQEIYMKLMFSPAIYLSIGSVATGEVGEMMQCGIDDGEVAFADRCESLAELRPWRHCSVWWFLCWPFVNVEIKAKWPVCR